MTICTQAPLALHVPPRQHWPPHAIPCVQTVAGVGTSTHSPFMQIAPDGQHWPPHAVWLLGQVACVFAVVQVPPEHWLVVQHALPQSAVPVGPHWPPLQTCPEPQQPPAQVALQSGADAAAVHCPPLQP